MKKPKKADPVEAFLSLPDDEKERIWESYNRPIPFSETRPLTLAEARLEKRVRRKALRGRPKIGEGSQRVQVTVERKLLRSADAFALKNGMTRAQLVARGIRLAMAS